LNIRVNPSDIETPDTQREDGKTTFEDSYMIGTDLMVYHDVVVDDDDDDDGILLQLLWHYL
jgi:hypothetical protein